MFHGLLSMELTQAVMKMLLFQTWSNSFAQFTLDLKKLMLANDLNIHHNQHILCLKYLNEF